MFTGLIEETGYVKSASKGNGARRIVISAEKIARKLRTGDSVAVSGVCLTALDITKHSFAADLAAETIARTSLAHLAPGSTVNLELPLAAGSPLGGHIVQGHVDGVAKLASLEKIRKGSDWRMKLELPAELERYVVEKGSITIEGVSLTVAAITDTTVEIAIIPHTYSATNLKTLKPGASLNVEVDVLAKYAEKRIGSGGITVEKLLQEGF